MNHPKTKDKIDQGTITNGTLRVIVQLFILNIKSQVLLLGMSRDALLVIHIPLLHFSFYPNIPQRNDTSPFWKSTVPTSGVTLTYFIWYVARYRFLSP